MSTSKFAEVHNLVAFLSKPIECEGFEQIAIVKAKNVNEEGQLPLVDGKKVIITESTIRRDLQLEDAEDVDCLPNAAIFEQLTLIGKSKRKDTELPQTSVPISVADEAVNKEMDDSLKKAATTATSLDAECQKAMGDVAAQTRSNRVSKVSNDLLLIGVNTPQSREDGLKINELMELGTNLQNMVLDLETTKTTQAMEIKSLKRRVKKLEKKQRSRTHKLKRLYKVFVPQEDPLKEVSDVDEVQATSTATTTTATIDDITLAKALIEIKSAKPKTTTASTTPKAKGLVIHDQEQTPTPTVSSQQPSHVKDTEKGKMVKPEHVKKFSKKDQLKLDEELALKLHAEEEKEERIAREKAVQIEEVNIAWDDVQAKVVANYKLAQRLQAEEQDELTDAEKEKLFMEFLEKKRKFFAAKRAKEKRNKPPTRAQQRTIMLEESSKKAKAEITQKGSLKRAGDEMEQERSKMHKVEDDKDSKELKKCLEIIPDDGDDVTIDATPLSSNKMLKFFDREDLEVLWRLVKDRFEKVKPVDNMDSFLLQNLKTMFEHHVKDNVGKNQQGLVKVKN
nr:hypothetical protein [Tanacetum cinerariifolium]